MHVPWERDCLRVLCNLQRLGTFTAPAIVMSVARIFFYGVKPRRDARHTHEGSCCFCVRRGCLGGVQRTVVTGCYIARLSEHSRYGWLAQCARNYFLLQFLSPHADKRGLQRCGNIAGILCDTVWHCDA
eukprot:6056076-Amphidinium_carterae.1